MIFNYFVIFYTHSTSIVSFFILFMIFQQNMVVDASNKIIVFLNFYIIISNYITNYFICIKKKEKSINYTYTINSIIELQSITNWEFTTSSGIVLMQQKNSSPTKGYEFFAQSDFS